MKIEIKYKNYIRSLFFIIGKILSYVNRITYKNKTSIVLYSNLGFRDNIEALYRYLISQKYNENYEIICVTNEWKKYTLESLPINVKFVNCYLGVFYYLTSKYFFYCFGKYPIKPTKKQYVVNLGHGMSLKRIASLNDSNISTDICFTHILVTSNFFLNLYKQSFKCSNEKFIISGQPRNDDFFCRLNLHKVFKISENKKLICYMPTFRFSEHLNINNRTIKNSVYEKLKKNRYLYYLNNKLVKLDIILFIKPHPMDSYDKNFIKNLGNIIYIDDNILKNKNLNTYKFLGNIDCLITDYSSVYFDYLLLNKPIGFIIDDMTEYGKNRGFIIDNPYSIMPGEKINNLKELIKFLEHISCSNDKYKEEREKINNLCNFYKNNFNKKLLEILNINTKL